MVIEAFGVGNVPVLQNSLIPVIESARSLDVPVVIVSQSARGAVDLARYGGGVAAARAGAIGAGDMTCEAALAKLMIALGRAEREDGGTETGRVRAAREAFSVARVGEMG
jgi:L-asparaginase